MEDAALSQALVPSRIPHPQGASPGRLHGIEPGSGLLLLFSGWYCSWPFFSAIFVCSLPYKRENGFAVYQW